VTLLVAVVLGIFIAFGAALAYAEFQTRDIYAPGAKKPD
jgi:hypothetical protein